MAHRTSGTPRSPCCAGEWTAQHSMYPERVQKNETIDLVLSMEEDLMREEGELSDDGEIIEVDQPENDSLASQLSDLRREIRPIPRDSLSGPVRRRPSPRARDSRFKAVHGRGNKGRNRQRNTPGRKGGPWADNRPRLPFPPPRPSFQGPLMHHPPPPMAMSMTMIPPSFLPGILQPPPPPPPPLPDSPPPEPPPPPPYSPPRESPRSPARTMKRAGRRGKPSWERLRPQSPPRGGDINDADYIDLLMEYKLIQKQLEEIKREEERAAQDTSNKSGTSSHKSRRSMPENHDGNSRPLDDRTNASGHHASTVGNKSTRDSSGRRARTRSRTKSPQPTKTNENDEEDLDELELRLAALASAAKANRKALEEGPSGSMAKPVEQKPGNRDKRKGAPSKRRVRHGGRKELVQAKKRRQQDVRSREAELRQARENTRREAQKILTIDDPEEQYHRFLQMVGAKQQRSTRGHSVGMSPGSEGAKKAGMTGGQQSTDNYEEVEMDMDSNPASPVIEVDAGDVDVRHGSDIEYDPTRPQMDLLTLPFPAGKSLAEFYKQKWPEEPPGVPGLEESLQGDSAETQAIVSDLLSAAAAAASASASPMMDDAASASASPVMGEVGEDDEGDEDAEDEDALRAALLQSLAQKKKQKEQTETSASRGESPVSMLPASGATGDKPNKPKLTMFPKHNPVVINLGDDTSESEEEQEEEKKGSSLLGSLDMFLKAARRSVEAKINTPKINMPKDPVDAPSSPPTPEALAKLSKHQVSEYRRLKEEIRKRESQKKADGTSVTSPKCETTDSRGVSPAREEKTEERVTLDKVQEQLTLEKKVKDLEDKVGRQRLLVQKDQNMLDSVSSQISRRKEIFRTAELKVQMLKEQLAAAEKIVSANVQQIEKLNLQAQAVQGRLDGKRETLQVLEAEVTQAGKAAYGDQYKYQPRTVNVERKIVSVTIANDKASKAQPQLKNTRKVLPIKAANTAVQRKSNAEQLAREKARLQRLEREYAEKIRQLKAAQLQKAEVAQSPGSRVRRASQRHKPLKSKPDKLITGEIIGLGSGSELDKDIVHITPQRRRSLNDFMTSPKPNLPGTLSNGSTVVQAGRLVLQNIVSVDESGKAKPAETVSKTKPVNPDEIIEDDSKTAFIMPSGQKLENLQRLQREKLSRIPHLDYNGDSGLQYDLTAAFYPSTKQIDGLKFENKSTFKNDSSPDCQPPCGLKTYRSCLLSFRCYRFSPYFRTKENKTLTSASCAHKVHIHRPLCRFDLTGTCNDENCPWQHKEDHTMSQDEILEDILSYCPSLAGVKPDSQPQDVPKLISDYVQRFRQQNFIMTADQQCLLMVSKVNEQAGHVPPYTAFYEARRWKPTQKDKVLKQKPGDADNKVQFPHVKESQGSAMIFEDHIINEEDVRYWMLSGQEVQDMETAVLDSPTDVHLWLKLAYKKLSCNTSTSESSLDQALNVLARALEANRSCSKLWTHYLELYSRREENTDLQHLCEQAVHYAPSYDLWWKRLMLASCVLEKDAICDKIKEFLCQTSVEAQEVKSHQVLEVILYQVAVSVQSGRLKTGVQILQTVVRPKTDQQKALTNQLLVTDLCLAWLVYIHVIEVRSLPPSLFDPSNNNPGRLVNKEPFLCPLKSKKDLKRLLLEACRKCTSTDKTAEENMQACMPLYRNLILLNVVQGNVEEAKAECRKLLQTCPLCTPLSLTLAQLEAQDNATAARDVFSSALVENPFCAQLYHGAATFELSQGNQDGALESLENCPIQLFEVDTQDFKLCDPNLLYCQILGQSLPLNFQPLAWKEGVTTELVRQQHCYLWLNYCLLLHLQGDDNQAVEAYETALCTLLNTKDVQKVWLAYIHYNKMKLSQSKKPVEDFRTLADLVDRCLTGMPSRFRLPHSSSHYWTDYTFHNSVVDAYLSCLPPDQLMPAYEKLVRHMPGNVGLALSLLTLYFMEADFHQYILFEIAHGSDATVQAVIARCQQLQVNTQDFLATILK